MNRRSIPVVIFAALNFCLGTASAQDYPAKPVRVLIPWPPGGANDIVGRVIAQLLGEELGWVNAQSVEVSGGYVV